MCRIARIVSGLLAAIAAVSIDAAPIYTATPLGAFSYGNGINAAGQVTGSSGTARFGPSHAIVYANGVLRDLGTLGGSFSAGNAINASGQVAGVAYTSDNARHAFLYSDGVMIDLGGWGEANGINASGQVTGYMAVFSVTAGKALEHTFLYSNGVMTDLGTFGGEYSIGNAINASGQVTGRYGAPRPGFSPVDTAFLYSNGVMRSLGTLGGASSSGMAINDRGHVTGKAEISGGQAEHAFLWYADFFLGSIMYDLGTLGDGDSIGLGINASVQIVGTYDTSSGGIAGLADRAFLYSDSTMYDLNSLVIGLASTQLLAANGINDSGQIVANGCSASRICQAFRLDPLPAGQGPPPVNKLAAIEFHHPALDHYFVTANANEIAALDNGMFPGWVRTGEAFNVYSGPSIDTATVCRFFSASFAPKSSHFYSPDAGECSVVKQNPAWQFEGDVMSVPVPDWLGACAAGTQPVYRLYNDGQGGAPNHRYTTSLATRAQMLSNGWIPEGYGVGVIMCAPL